MSSSCGELGCSRSCLIKFGQLFSHYFFSCSAHTPLSQIPTELLVSLLVSCRPLWHWSLLSDLFFFCSSDSLNPIKVTDSSAYSNLPLNPFSEFFISISELFSSKIFFAFFLDFLSLIGILILFIYHSLTFPHLPLVQSLSSAFDVRSFSDVIFVNFFFPLTGPYFYFSVCLVILLLKTGHLNPIMW